jgi:hypothetical protein
VFPVCVFIIEEFEGFLDVRNTVSHLHVHTREVVGNTVCQPVSDTISLSEDVNDHSYCPTPYPASCYLLPRRIASPVCFTSPNGTALNSISTTDVFTVDLCDRILVVKVIQIREIPLSPCQTTEYVRLPAYGLEQSILLKGIQKSVL